MFIFSLSFFFSKRERNQQKCCSEPNIYEMQVKSLRFNFTTDRPLISIGFLFGHFNPLLIPSTQAERTAHIWSF